MAACTGLGGGRGGSKAQGPGRPGVPSRGRMQSSHAPSSWVLGKRSQGHRAASVFPHLPSLTRSRHSFLGLGGVKQLCEMRRLGSSEDFCEVPSVACGDFVLPPLRGWEGVCENRLPRRRVEGQSPALVVPCWGQNASPKPH